MESLSAALAVFQKGGLVMYPLLLCSIIVMAIAIERFQAYRRADTDADALLAKLGPLLAQGDNNGALEVCRLADGVIPDVLAEGLKHPHLNSHGLENMLSGAASLAAANLRKRLGILDTIVTLAPLLGLLGTVVGMISSFSVMNIASGQPRAITGGVGEALVATAAGLCVAVLALAVHSYFVYRLDAIVTDLERGCTFLLTAMNRSERHETA
ncbi:MotA/TolQ/ExbB proton channel family protein [Anaeroselena agilis]|uniref:MotA/TolQ/ExbB proton channel family protein n=1 Tax=Anaeroselena agilis TaxID=3063788 RepID=A0ABU3P5V6_9FIRM|nr:MotA/TolQ/ExbB proton channel family protein [Selenomonadales bacterium 4137-cl]